MSAHRHTGRQLLPPIVRRTSARPIDG